MGWRTGIALFLTLLWAGCSSGGSTRHSLPDQPRAEVLRKLLRGEPTFLILQAGASHPEALCRGFRLKPSDVKRFFWEAREVSAPSSEDKPDDLFSCYVKGVLKDSDSRYRWTIHVDGRGELQLSRDTTIRLSCPKCAERYTGH